MKERARICFGGVGGRAVCLFRFGHGRSRRPTWRVGFGRTWIRRRDMETIEKINEFDLRLRPKKRTFEPPGYILIFFVITYFCASRVQIDRNKIRRTYTEPRSTVLIHTKTRRGATTNRIPSQVQLSCPGKRQDPHRPLSNDWNGQVPQLGSDA